ncbi:DUF3348 domain-containing protein [Variovorax sp. GB1P17]|uniref:DUF3348 domain-containing protein n=1 Tax=Variovorax sp. GB1P17 TaxID=3443740 RepID=UPI003F47A1B4
MAQASQRTVFHGSTLVRLLSRLTDIDVRESRQGTADRLSQWFGWTDAISLSAALDGSPAAVQSSARASGSAEETEFTRVRAALTQAIAEDSAPTVVKKRGNPLAAAAPAGDTPVDAAPAFAPYRRRYLTRQQAMETRIAPLRARVRATLAVRSPAMARLAAVDVVMEQALAAQERRLLATVPVLLGTHFERLRQAAQPAPDDTQAPAEPDSEAPSTEWLNVFCKHMQDVLLAELDIRLQPVEGLLEALRTS